MAEKVNFRCDMSMIKNPKEMMYSVLPAVAGEYPNGLIGYLGDFEEGSNTVRKLLAPTSTLRKGKLPVICNTPEVAYNECSKASQALGLFRNPQGKILRAREVGTAIYGVTLSEDYLDMNSKGSALAVGDIFTIQDNLVVGTQLKYQASAPEDGNEKVYFKVVKVFNASAPVTFAGDGQLIPSVYKLVDLVAVVQ